MEGKFPIPDLSGAPIVGYSFLVVFFPGGVIATPNPIDIRFQRVSGINVNFEGNNTLQVEQGSLRQPQRALPGKPSYSPLVLERGLFTGNSPLSYELQATLFHHFFRFQNVLVALMDEAFVPVSNWMFLDAYPISWSISDLDADQSQVVIERLEMRYSSFKAISLGHEASSIKSLF